MGYDRRLVGALPAAAIAGALGATLFLGGPGNPVTAQDTANITQEQRAIATSLESAFMRLAETAKPAAVYITARREATRSPGSFAPEEEETPFGELFPGFPRIPRGQRPGTASGSGVIVREDGYILTNDHVVAGADKVWVTLNDGTRHAGRVIRDRQSDLAVVKIEASKPLPYVRMADSGKVRVGQWAVAIGSPFGNQGTVTTGIVSAVGRKAEIGAGEDGRYYPNLIQTDAAINRGNSGGPLLNINGELIGINVAIESPSGANAGIGFAIPANTARSVMEQLITRGKVVRGYMGVRPVDIPADLRGRLGTDKGAYVEVVSPNTPAQKAGIRAGDVITRFGEKVVADEVDLRDTVAATAPDTRVPVTLLRDGQTRTVNVVIGALPEERVASAAPAETRPAGKLGIRTATLSADVAQELKLDANVKGVVVNRVDPGSAASEAGLAPRDIITAVNGRPVASAEALDRAMSAAKPGEIVTLTVLRFVQSEELPAEAVVNVTVP
jgi:serine protease Do